MSEYDRSWFVSTDAEGHFHASVTNRLGIKEWGFELDADNARTEGFYKVRQDRGGQLFCQHPNAAAMTVVREFLVNA